MANSNRLLLLLTMLSLAITIITASSFSFSEPDLSYAQSLGNIKDLSTDATDAHDPQVLVCGSNIYAIWVDFVTGNDDIYFKRSIDRGASFGDTINLSNNPGDSYNFKVSLSGDYMYIVWQDETLSVNGTDDVFFKRSTDGGASFGDTINLSNDTGDSIRPEIAVSDSNVFIVWQNQAMKGDNVFFKRSTDGGASFGDTINLSNNPGDSTDPDITSANDGSAYIVWTDNYKGRSKVFFRVLG
jgi:hypothetical protein